MSANAIVCAVDGSAAAGDAVSVAAGLARILELELLLLHVVEPEPAVTVAASPYHYAPAPYRDLPVASRTPVSWSAALRAAIRPA